MERRRGGSPPVCPVEKPVKRGVPQSVFLLVDGAAVVPSPLLGEYWGAYCALQCSSAAAVEVRHCGKTYCGNRASVACPLINFHKFTGFTPLVRLDDNLEHVVLEPRLEDRFGLRPIRFLFAVELEHFNDQITDPFW